MGLPTLMIRLFLIPRFNKHSSYSLWLAQLIKTIPGKKMAVRISFREDLVTMRHQWHTYSFTYHELSILNEQFQGQKNRNYVLFLPSLTGLIAQASALPFVK